MRERLVRPPSFYQSLDRWAFQKFLEDEYEKGRMIFLHKIMWNVYHEGLMTVVVVVGRPRVGKSNVSARIMYEIDPDFSAETLRNQTFFSILQLILNLRNLRGRAVWNDESGKDLDPMRWASLTNRLFNVALQTQGLNNKFYILTVPHARFIAKLNRYFINYIIHVKRRGLLRVYEVTTDWADLKGEGIYRSLVEEVHHFPQAPDDIWSEFEKLEAEQKDIILEDLVAEARAHLEQSAAHQQKEFEELRQRILERLERLGTTAQGV